MSPDPIYPGFVVPVCGCAFGPCSSRTCTRMASEQRPALTFPAHHYCGGVRWLCGEKITSRAVGEQHTKRNHFTLAVVLG